MISFVVPGASVPKGRPKASLARPRRTRGGGLSVPQRKIVMRTPKATSDFEDLVGLVARRAWDGVERTGPLVLVATFVRPRPARLNRRSSPEGRILCDVLADGDNLLKAIADGLQRGKVLTNDSRIAVWVGLKVWAAKGEQPHAVVRLGTADERGDMLLDFVDEVDACVVLEEAA